MFIWHELWPLIQMGRIPLLAKNQHHRLLKLGCTSWSSCCFWDGVATPTKTTTQRESRWGVVQCLTTRVMACLFCLVERWDIKYLWKIIIWAAFQVWRLKMMNIVKWCFNFFLPLLTKMISFWFKTHCFGQNNTETYRFN